VTIPTLSPLYMLNNDLTLAYMDVKADEVYGANLDRFSKYTTHG
jgi:hypothetical protein